MSATVLVGSQWGDEGKGKVTDLVSGDFDCVCRYQGGANAGHTVVANGHKLALHRASPGPAMARAPRSPFCAPPLAMRPSARTRQRLSTPRSPVATSWR